MKLVLIGSGAREHAQAWAATQSPVVKEVIVAPGNPGIARLPKCRIVPIAAMEINKLVELAEKEKPDLTIVGPEDPLVKGAIVDRWPQGLRIFGPSAKAALLTEGSKIEANLLKTRLGINTAPYKILDTPDEAIAYLRTLPPDTECVVKLDGLWGGKGVTVCDNVAQAIAKLEEIKLDPDFIKRGGDRVVIEERLRGREFSLFALCGGRGQTAKFAGTAKDYKRIGEGDIGPNCGGTGCYAPAILTPAQIQYVMDHIAQPVADETDFVGYLYVGGMITDDGTVWVIEFNCRLGDPEAEVVLPLVDYTKTDLIHVQYALAGRNQYRGELAFLDEVAVGVFLMAHGYPGKVRTKDEIFGLERLHELFPDILDYWAGIGINEQGKYVTKSGRLACFVARAKTYAAARDKVYPAVNSIEIAGMQMRRDIAEGI